MDSSGQTPRQAPSQILGIWRWILDGVRPTMPRALLRLGRFGVTRVQKLDASLDGIETGGLAYGVLGDAYSCDTPRNPDMDVLVFPDDLQYRRVVSVSPAVLRRGRSGIRLQLEDLSPIPTDKIAFAFRDTGVVDAGAHQVELAITEQRHLDQLLAAKVAGRTVLIAGSTGDDGAPELVYATTGLDQRALVTLALVVSLIGAVFLALFGWSARLETEAANLRADQAGLIARVRQARDVEADLQALADAPVSQLRLPTVLHQLEEVGARSGGLQTIQQVRLQADGSLILLGRDGDGEYREAVVEMAEGEDE